MLAGVEYERAAPVQSAEGSSQFSRSRNLAMPDPEALARVNIDRLLTEAGWLVVDRYQTNILAGRGIAFARSRFRMPK